MTDKDFTSFHKCIILWKIDSVVWCVFLILLPEEQIDEKREKR